MLVHNIIMPHHPSRNSFPRAKIHCYCHTSKTKVRKTNSSPSDRGYLLTAIPHLSQLDTMTV
jgi:hypothetical protein